MIHHALRSLATVALAVTLAAVANAADDEGFKPLFDGQSLEGWQPIGGSAAENWNVRDGLLVTNGGSGWLSTAEEYSDFVLELEFRFEEGGNSGVFLRAPHEGNPAYTGMEIQVLDDSAERYANLQPYQYCGSVYGIKAAERGHVKPAGEWNQYRITADGDKITIELNGTVITEADLSEHTEKADTNPGITRESGYIGLQSHGDPVEYRNIRIKTLD